MDLRRRARGTGSYEGDAMSVKTNATVSMHDQRGGHGQTKQHQQASVKGVLFGRDPFDPAQEGEGVDREGMDEEGESGEGEGGGQGEGYGDTRLVGTKEAP